MTNTKTTIAGIITILAAILTVVAVVLQGGTPDWQHAGATIIAALGLVAGGVGLIKASDATK
jgi:hypothetical protein